MKISRRPAPRTSPFLRRQDASCVSSASFRVWLEGPAFADDLHMESKRIVYILKNLEYPPKYYIGLTANLRQRLDDHNRGGSPHTAAHRPWVVDVAIEFRDERRAVAFEKYLKSGSGYAFAVKHLR